ncbi:hypothetical protein GCM10010174_70290 [Kutzneria viridogrisea]|uniref:NIPSNAP domain-containing protein n=1 Tax=Kutzneria viridogrisea TaxID=47990 RepID=A0ABR6BAS8_9PSEU|nr:hypothetical protein [Kutzneria viridogrisea]
MTGEPVPLRPAPSTALEDAIRVWPELEALRYLDGWTWQVCGSVVSRDGLLGYRSLTLSGLWLEVLLIFGPDDCEAQRAFDNRAVWERRGTVAEVLAAVAVLPPPGAPGAPLLPATGWRTD